MTLHLNRRGEPYMETLKLVNKATTLFMSYFLVYGAVASTKKDNTIDPLELKKKTFAGTISSIKDHKPNR